KIVRAWDIEKDKNKVLSIFQKENTSLSDERYWEILRTVWILCGSVDNVNLFRHYFASKRPQKHYFSTPEEAKRLREMPDEFKVYRATNAATLTEDSGISWTLSYEYAVWYRDAYHKKFLQERLIDKPQVFALIERNKEEEIIIL
ncbi:MAG: hypothetical protein GX885_11515, partial [Methanomicrobiales archaeon]|nr:hypothetical protein [Methanomicrobiales archaeon]